MTAEGLYADGEPNQCSQRDKLPDQGTTNASDCERASKGALAHTKERTTARLAHADAVYHAEGVPSTRLTGI